MQEPEEYDYRYWGNTWGAFGVEGAVVVPVGALKDSAGTGFGGLAKLWVVGWNDFGWAIRSGFIGHTSIRPSEAIKLTRYEVPILLGPRVYWDIFYIGCEVGPVINMVRVTGTDAGGEEEGSSSKKTRVGGAVGAGLFDLFGFMDIGVGVFSPSIYWPDEPTTVGVMFNLGVSLPFHREGPYRWVRDWNDYEGGTSVEVEEEPSPEE